MRPFLAGALTLVLAVTLVPLAAAEECTRVDSPYYGRVEYGCDKASDEAWWASGTAQAVYAVVGLVASAGGAGYAYWRVRRRRETLAGFVRRLDETLAAHKATPAVGAARLVTLRREVKLAFGEGRLDDAHYLELDKRAATGIVKLRLLEMDQRFPQLAPGLRAHVATIISDGNVSTPEVELIRAATLAHPVPGFVRDELVSMLSQWARQDSGDSAAPSVPAGAPPAAPVSGAPAADEAADAHAPPVMVRITRRQ